MQSRRKGPEMLTMPALKVRGWTEGLVRKFLQEPDATAPNPMYKSAAPMRLYRKSRVMAAERAEGFAEAAEMASRRSRKATEAAAVKREAAMKWAKSVDISVPQISRAEAIRRGYAEKARWSADKEFSEPLDRMSDIDGETLERWALNYVRHQCTGYDQMLYDRYGTIGIKDVRNALHERINDAVRAQWKSKAMAGGSQHVPTDKAA